MMISLESAAKAMCERCAGADKHYEPTVIRIRALPGWWHYCLAPGFPALSCKASPLWEMGAKMETEKAAVPEGQPFVHSMTVTYDEYEIQARCVCNLRISAPRHSPVAGEVHRLAAEHLDCNRKGK
jgi:hypothetical protein